jgi:hypothetical protein
MTCLTNEQIVKLVVQPGDEVALAAHIDACDACRSKMQEVRQLTDRLAAIHSEAERTHAVARAQLLAKISTIDAPAKKTAAVTWFSQQISRLTIRQRLAAGGIGLTGAFGILLLIIFASSAERLSAMERMAKQLREVTSFSYELEEISDRITGDNRRSIKRNDVVYWSAPASLRATTKIVKLPLPPPPGAVGEETVDVEEIYTKGHRGILIDHKRRQFFRTPEMPPDDFDDSSPVNWLQRMSKGSVKIVADLGTKQLYGNLAHGYVVSLGHPDPKSGQNAIHLWVDTETDLPIEYRYEESDTSDEVDSWKSVMRAYNCRWNIELDDELFLPMEPAGYDDTTWPRDEKSVAAMVDALRLYAVLSGGHYPRVSHKPGVTGFHGDEIQQEMFRLAASAAQSQNEKKAAELHQQVEQVKAGLDLITRALKNSYHTGYYGMEVTHNDNEKLLMWWPADVGDGYQVIYGDLRAENLPLAEWFKLVPPDVAASRTPLEYSKPNE